MPRHPYRSSSLEGIRGLRDFGLIKFLILCVIAIAVIVGLLLLGASFVIVGLVTPIPVAAATVIIVRPSVACPGDERDAPPNHP